MKFVAEHIDGYTYGSGDGPVSPVSMTELRDLLVTAGWTEEDERYLRLAGEVLGDQTRAVVHLWRNQIIASNPHLARHSRGVEGELLPEYLSKSNLRFEQWILDTCLRPYDQAWLDYQQEIALRHTSRKKNAVDHVHSTSHVPFRDVISFLAVMNETIRPFLANKGHATDVIEGMHTAWRKSMQIQLALWAKTYSDTQQGPGEW